MGIEKTERSVLGPALILVILLADVGLVIWGWHLYQRRQDRLDSAGLNFNRAPEAEAPALPAAPPAAPEAPTGIDRYVKKEVLPEPRPAAGGGPPAASSAGKPGLAAAAASPQAKLKMGRAVSHFFDLKKSPRFKGSKVVQEWKRDFLSYPDLKAVNERWRKDRDPLKFMVGMVRSPNFQKMALKYLAQKDMQDFVSAMASSPAVKESAGSFMADDSIKTAVGGLGLAKLAGTPAVMANPALKGYLEGADPAPPVR